MKLKVFIFSPFCLLRPTTNRIFDMRLSDGFAGHNTDVTIIYPYTYMKSNIQRSEIPVSYGMKHQVKSRMLLTPLLENSPEKIRAVMLMVFFSFSALRIFIAQLFSRREAVIFSRDARLLVMALFLKKIFGRLLRVKVVYMCAEVKNSMLLRFVLANSNGVFAGVSTVVDAIMKLVKIPNDRFILSLAPVPSFEHECSKEKAREVIRYNSDKPLIVYTGKIGIRVNELKYILEAASLLPEYQFIATGGSDSNVEFFRKYCTERKISNVVFTGFFNESSQVRFYQLAADVLVSYYNSNDHMVEYNYPQKLNEYLSTRNPIVTPDFPATRDVINDRNVFFVEPDKPAALAEGIKKVIDNKDLAAKIAAQAYEDAKKHTFESKSLAVLEFVNRLK